MTNKKICLLGSFAVGKTSLINQFVNESFSFKYHTTIGVKIDKKDIKINNSDLGLLIWDIHGQDNFQNIRSSYIMGASGYFIVVDATRRESLGVVRELMDTVKQTVGDIPYNVLVNKSDLGPLFEISNQDLKDIGINEEDIIWTSARTGLGVQTAFITLGNKMTNGVRTVK
ncbi:MAG: Rab family GTPase [Draconibacterium sp.]